MCKMVKPNCKYVIKFLASSRILLYIYICVSSYFSYDFSVIVIVIVIVN